MPLFEIDTNTLQAKRLSAGTFKLEKDLQKIIERNLDEIFGVRFIATEFIIHGEEMGRIDTIGLDYEGAPTIIEYKRDRNHNVVNQGRTYVGWLLKSRGNFTLAAQKILGEVEIDWSHPRLIVIAQDYEKWDKGGTDDTIWDIELWKYMCYGDNLLYLDSVHRNQKSRPKHTKKIKLTKTQVEVSTLVNHEPEYTLDYHLDSRPLQVRELFESLRKGILDLASEDEIVEVPNKTYISYRHGKNFCEINFTAKGLKVYLDILHHELDDPENISRDVSGIGRNATGDTEVKLHTLEDVDYVVGLIEQAYRLTL